MFEDLHGAIAAVTNAPLPLWVKSPIDHSKLEGQGGDTLDIVLRGAVTDGDAKALGAFSRKHTRVSLCLSSFTDLNDLSLLAHFPNLNAFYLRNFDFDNFDHLSFLPENLDCLYLENTHSKRLSLSFIARHKKLKELFIESHTKDLDAIGSLTELNDLTLRSITLPNLKLLTPLKKLRALDIKLGGTKNLAELPNIGELRYLELWMIKGLSDLDAISYVQSLQQIHLENLKNVVVMPSLKNLANLRRISLLGMKGLRNLMPIADAPNLLELHIGGSLELDLKDLTPFKNHKSLKYASVGVGSLKRNAAIEKYLGLPGLRGPTAIRKGAE